MLGIVIDFCLNQKNKVSGFLMVTDSVNFSEYVTIEKIYSIAFLWYIILFYSLKCPPFRHCSRLVL